MKKRMTALISCMALLMALLSAALAAELPPAVVLRLDSPWCAAGTQTELIDADNALVTPFAEDGHTLVPVGRIVKAFGGSSSWDILTNRAAFTLDGHSVVVEVGTRNAWVDGIPIAMDAAARGKHNRTYVPLRFVLGNLIYGNLIKAHTQSLKLKYLKAWMGTLQDIAIYKLLI